MARLQGCRRAALALTLVLLAFIPACSSGGHEARLSVGAPVAVGGITVLRPRQSLNHEALEAAFRAVGAELPEGTSLYAAQILRHDGVLSYDEYDAGDGAFTTDFWPASSIKVVAAVGALEFLAGMGFTGAARVTTEDGSVAVRDLYEEALRDSSNGAYDWLVSIPGVDWLNTEFLVPGNGFTATVIQRSYTDPESGLVPSPVMTISEGERTLELPAREVEGTDRCPDRGNCSNLLEMSDTLRRIVLVDEIPPTERFVIAPEDVAALRRALLEAEGFIDPGAEAVFGVGTPVFNKPGQTLDDECVDVGLVEGPRNGYMLAITTPVDGRECATLTELAQVALSFLEHAQP
ncbi:MAG: hypothetical protein M3314_02625 [Actinomycetota bacterium]|nr:hypothetical protein [Actinomycetota bacterium]